MGYSRMKPNSYHICHKIWIAVTKQPTNDIQVSINIPEVLTGRIAVSDKLINMNTVTDQVT
jgi:hypothetical protein